MLLSPLIQGEWSLRGGVCRLHVSLGKGKLSVSLGIAGLLVDAYMLHTQEILHQLEYFWEFYVA